LLVSTLPDFAFCAHHFSLPWSDLVNLFTFSPNGQRRSGTGILPVDPGHHRQDADATMKGDVRLGVVVFATGSKLL
jgi:hypothetical protein